MSHAREVQGKCRSPRASADNHELHALWLTAKRRKYTKKMPRGG
jgi:hypothetical protein